MPESEMSPVKVFSLVFSRPLNLVLEKYMLNKWKYASWIIGDDHNKTFTIDMSQQWREEEKSFRTWNF